MQLNIKTIIIVSIALFALGWGSGYYTKPTSVETKIVEVTKEDTTKNQKTSKVITKERIVYKDGTVVEREKSEDKASNYERSLKESHKSTEKVVKNDIGLNLSMLAVNPHKADRDYGIHVSKRVFSNITVGAFATTKKDVGLSVGVSF